MDERASKYLILVGDGMADEPQKELDGKTPLEKAQTPHMDRVASRGILGLTETIGPHQEPGSDVANMAILGYDPDQFHTGRAPLEAASMGVELFPGEVAFRCNLVSVEFDAQGELVLVDYSSQLYRIGWEMNGSTFIPGSVTATFWSGKADDLI
jgi:2,3-bisphosphoglycerate-independent phosphoglycerate mutase